MNRWLALLPLVALVALAALFVGWSLNRDPQVKPDAMVGKPVPVTVLPLLNGPGELDLKTAGVGKPMIVNVFASWCAPCRIEHPRLMALKAQGVRLVGVAQDLVGGCVAAHSSSSESGSRAAAAMRSRFRPE